MITIHREFGLSGCFWTIRGKVNLLRWVLFQVTLIDFSRNHLKHSNTNTETLRHQVIFRFISNYAAAVNYVISKATHLQIKSPTRNNSDLSGWRSFNHRREICRYNYHACICTKQQCIPDLNLIIRQHLFNTLWTPMELYLFILEPPVLWKHCYNTEQCKD